MSSPLGRSGNSCGDFLGEDQVSTTELRIETGLPCHGAVHDGIPGADTLGIVDSKYGKGLRRISSTTSRPMRVRAMTIVANRPSS